MRLAFLLVKFRSLLRILLHHPLQNLLYLPLKHVFWDLKRVKLSFRHLNMLETWCLVGVIPPLLLPRLFELLVKHGRYCFTLLMQGTGVLWSIFDFTRSLFRLNGG